MPHPNVVAFANRWNGQGYEKGQAHQHVLDLCDALGVPTPHPGDANYVFEKHVTKLGGGKGFADVWWRGHFAWEYKSMGEDLRKAYSQLNEYREALENPPLLLVCDFARFEVHTNFVNTPPTVYRFTLTDLRDDIPVSGTTFTGESVLHHCFGDYGRLHPARVAEDVTKQAAVEFARLAGSLQSRGADPEQAARFLMRLLFCLFAEDIRLLPHQIFAHLVENSRHKPAFFNRAIRQLFAAMAEPDGFFGSDIIRWFNGGLFTADAALAEATPDLTAADLEVLHQAARLDWSNIEPAIFGTLFERSLDPNKRAQLGAHYTSRADILLIVEPVLMTPLRRRWAVVQEEATALLAKRDAATARPARERHEQDCIKLLLDFANELGRTRVLDPACGSGNFLYVALGQLLDLWHEVASFPYHHNLPVILPRTVGPHQLYGIEKHVYAYELASLVVWIGYIQWLHEHNYTDYGNPILRRLDNIHHQDAVLTYDDAGHPVEPPWPDVDVIIGNPPFLGDKKMRGELGDQYVEELRTLYADRIPGQSDLVCYWFERAREQLMAKKVRRAGLLATQGIRGGANRRVLERIKQNGNIFWAQSDRNWILDGANVHVSMVGFDRGEEVERTLDGRRVEMINADLSSRADLPSATQLNENHGLSFIGTQKTGPFDLSEDQASSMLASVGNPNARPNSDVIKKWINALDITQRPRKMWIIDFGVDRPLDSAALYEQPFEYVRKYVKPVRDQVNRKNHREKWWLFGETRVGMRRAISHIARYIATPLVSKHRLYAWISADVIPENLVVVIARDDDYFLGVLHSHIHELWSRAMGTQLREAESGSRYTPTTTFETFPFPWPPGQEPTTDPRVEAIGAIARRLVELRDNWLNPPDISESELKKRTLTNLYNLRPSWLEAIHRKLDDAVLEAYGWPTNLTDADILEQLLALNRERAGTGANSTILSDEQTVSRRT